MAAKFVLKDCQVSVNGVDFTGHCSSVELHLEKDDVETTSFSGSGRERVAGLRNEKITLNLQQDFSTGSPDNVDLTLWTLYNGETEFTVFVRPHTAARSTTNPEYTATCILLEYEPLSGKVGDLSETSVEFVVQRGTLSRLTA